MSEITVFISYSHDSDAHRKRVLGLSERLRTDGIATMLDQYVERGSPPEGWPRWMMNGLHASTYVVCVFTETYYHRFRGDGLGKHGKGADWEGALVTQALYDARNRTNRFIPVIFDGADEQYVPEPLRAQTYYLLASEGGYEALYDSLLSQSGVEAGAIGELRSKPRAVGQPASFGRGDDKLQPALIIWRDKLEFLLVEDAICVDPAMKFRLKHLIDEAEAKIRSLESGER